MRTNLNLRQRTLLLRALMLLYQDAENAKLNQEKPRVITEGEWSTVCGAHSPLACATPTLCDSASTDFK